MSYTDSEKLEAVKVNQKVSKALKIVDQLACLLHELPTSPVYAKLRADEDFFISTSLRSLITKVRVIGNVAENL
jgi:hypothetical protein